MTTEDTKIAITGAGGTIGRIISNNLGDMRIVRITRQQYNIANQKDFSNMMADVRPTILVHCAAAGVKGGSDFDQSQLLNNLQMAENIAAHSNKLRHIFNIGSGAEYGITNDLNKVTEPSVESFPLPEDGYGLSKRLSWQRLKFTGNSTNLRIFGCFDRSEPEYRLLRKFVNSVADPRINFTLETDRKFSWISGNDLARVVYWAVKKKLSDDPSMPAEINVAYPETADLMLSDILEKWCKIHGKAKTYQTSGKLGKPYTCDSGLMMSLMDQPLAGLEKSLKDYL
jgi:nucleoside-diphosphate-sugar epimerase